MKKAYFTSLTLIFFVSFLFGFNLQARTKSPPNAAVYIISPTNGLNISGSVHIQFGLRGMGVAPAGVTTENTGHHHLLIDTDKLPNMDQPIPKDDKHRHFGGGQTETRIDLPPGKHTLQIILGDAAHIPHDPPVISKKVTITVK